MCNNKRGIVNLTLLVEFAKGGIDFPLDFNNKGFPGVGLAECGHFCYYSFTKFCCLCAPIAPFAVLDKERCQIHKSIAHPKQTITFFVPCIEPSDKKDGEVK